MNCCTKIGKTVIKNVIPVNNKISVRRYYVPRRALMYVPGDDLKKINKSLTLDVDCIALDCEDGVAVNRKREARENIRLVLENSKPKRNIEYDLGVRINALDTSYWREDLKSCLTAQHLPDTVLVPKVETGETIKLFSDEVSNFVTGDYKINLIIYIETAKSFLNLLDICNTAKDLSTNGKFRPVSLVFGSDDFCANIGVTRTEDATEILYARQKLVMVAKAFSLQAIDMVYIKYKAFKIRFGTGLYVVYHLGEMPKHLSSRCKGLIVSLSYFEEECNNHSPLLPLTAVREVRNLDGLKAQCDQGMRMGYTGKQVIHPGQVPIVQDAFLPSTSQVEWATGLLKSFEKHQQEGKGAFTYKESMIDMPTMKQAENIVKLAKLKKNLLSKKL